MSLSLLTRLRELKHMIRSPIMTNRRLGPEYYWAHRYFLFCGCRQLAGCLVASQCGLFEVCVEIVWLGDLLVRSSDLRGVIPHPQKVQDWHVSSVRPGSSVTPGEPFNVGRFAGQMPEHLLFYLFNITFSYILFPLFLIGKCKGK